LDVDKRLQADAESFAKETASLDVDGFINRTLAVLGILPADSDTEGSPRAGRSQRPAPAGGSQHQRPREDGTGTESTGRIDRQ